MRSSWDPFSRIIERDILLEARKKGAWSTWPQSWKYVEKNIKNMKWFFSRNPLHVLRDLMWWVKHRTTHRFHVIKLKSLKPGWVDTDARLLHASFALLENYVEKEKPFKIVDWNDDDDSREYANEIHALYLWWKKHKTHMYEDVDFNSMAEEDKVYQEETNNLVRLMKIRAVLWT